MATKKATIAVLLLVGRTSNSSFKYHRAEHVPCAVHTLLLHFAHIPNPSSPDYPTWRMLNNNRQFCSTAFSQTQNRSVDRPASHQSDSSRGVVRLFLQGGVADRVSLLCKELYKTLAACFMLVLHAHCSLLAPTSV